MGCLKDSKSGVQFQKNDEVIKVDPRIFPNLLFCLNIAPLSRLQIESATFYRNVDLLNRAESILPIMVTMKV